MSGEQGVKCDVSERQGGEGSKDKREGGSLKYKLCIKSRPAHHWYSGFACGHPPGGDGVFDAYRMLDMNTG